MNFKSKIVYFFNLIIFILILTSCNNNKNREVNITKWDNSKYDNWASSVGLDVYNKNSTNKTMGKNNKENSILHITNLNEPITLKFNNNGKKRNFIISIFYDYKQIPFKIGKTGKFDKNYKFELDDSYEVELPLYLPQDTIMSGSHKLLISFSMGYDIYAKDLKTQSDWYGINLAYDITYNDSINFNDDTIIYNKPKHTIDLTYSFMLNQDYDYKILEDGIMPNVNKLVEVKKNSKFNLVYNVSTIGSNTEKVLLLITFNYLQTNIDNSNYKLLEIPKNTTGIGTIELLSPNEPGLYEVIALCVYNPFDKINQVEDFNIDSNTRFTLKVIE